MTTKDNAFEQVWLDYSNDKPNDIYAMRKEFKKFWDAALSDETVTLPDGWVAVPVEPTNKQIHEGRKYFDNTYDWTFVGLYKAMLQAAPTCEKEKG